MFDCFGRLRRYIVLRPLIFFALFVVGDFVSARTCELPIGERSVVDVDKESSDSGVEKKYLVERSSKSQYNVYVNFNLMPLPPPVLVEKGVTYETNTSPRVMMQKIKGCFEKINSQIFDPSSKSQITIIPIDPNYARSNNLRVPQVDIIIYPKRFPQDRGISLLSPYFRSSSREYSEAITCQTIVHETFHLLGLGDEYGVVDPMLGIVVTKDKIFTKRGGEYNYSGTPAKNGYQKFSYWGCMLPAAAPSIMSGLSLGQAGQLGKSIISQVHFLNIINGDCEDGRTYRYNYCINQGYLISNEYTTSQLYDKNKDPFLNSNMCNFAKVKSFCKDYDHKPSRYFENDGRAAPSTRRAPQGSEQ